MPWSNSRLSGGCKGWRSHQGQTISATTLCHKWHFNKSGPRRGWMRSYFTCSTITFRSFHATMLIPEDRRAWTGPRRPIKWLGVRFNRNCEFLHRECVWQCDRGWTILMKCLRKTFGVFNTSEKIHAAKIRGNKTRSSFCTNLPNFCKNGKIADFLFAHKIRF